MKLRAAVGFVCAVLLGTGQCWSAARADVVYSYTGNDFTSVSGSYTTSDFVTVNFELAAPLGDNTGPISITPISFSISDGVQTVTNNTAVSSLFDITTDQSGNIQSWAIYVQVSSSLAEIKTCEDPTICYPIVDQGDYYSNDGQYNYGNAAPNLNGWTITTTPNPEALPLFAAGLGALGLLGWRKKRKPTTAVA